MRILIATDAWHPQVNGVVRTLTALRESADRLGAEVVFLSPEGFAAVPDAVAEKGDAARLHAGMIAQEVEAAFRAQGLDPSRYALWCLDPQTTVVKRITSAQKPKMVPITTTRPIIKVVDGKAIQDVEEVEGEEPEWISYPLFAPDGEPLGTWDREGNFHQATHDVQVMETVETETEEVVPLLGEDGQPVTRLGLRYEQCSVFEAAWQRRRGDRIEARLAAIEARSGGTTP